MSEAPKLWHFIIHNTIKEDGYEPREMQVEFLISGATMAEAWKLFEEKLIEQTIQYDYIQVMEYNPAMAVIV